MIAPVLYSSASPDWWTPAYILEAARDALGWIDLDPCAPLGRPHHVSARERFTIDDDGLSQAWRGRVYLNPPYGREVGRWVAKAIAELDAGHMEAAIVLVAARTDTAWFNALARRCVAWCAVAGRLRFIDGATGHEAPYPAGFPSAIVYLSRDRSPDDIDRFCRAFGPLGLVYEVRA